MQERLVLPTVIYILEIYGTQCFFGVVSILKAFWSKIPEMLISNAVT